MIARLAGWQHNEGASVGDILGLNAMFAAGLGLAAWLFAQALDHTANYSPRPQVRRRK